MDDNESYWNRSTSKAFSFDDDEHYLSTAPVDLGYVVDGASGSILNDDAISEASFDNSAIGCALNLSIKSIISEDALKVILQEQTLDDRLVSKGVAPEEELKLLRRQVQTTFYNPSPEITAYKLLLGKSVPLEVFKSLHEKEQLLDTIFTNGGGDAVIGVILFLKKTLNPVNFHKLLKQRPKALQHYISYLRQRQNHQEASELLQPLGKHTESAIIQFNAAMQCNNLALRKQKLQTLCEYYKNCGVVSVYQQIFHATSKLCELIEKEHHVLGDNIVNLNSTPIEILYACCSKHNNWKEQDLTRATSPFRLCAEQQISAAQFEWTALNERACAQAYADLETVFERIPTWHPMKQKQFHISFTLNSAIVRLYELRAPTSVLYLFLTKMTNNEEKLQLAQRVKCTKAIIDALVGQRDVTQLTQMKATLPERSEEHFYCDKALKGLQTKRWSTDNIKLKL